MDLLFSYPSQPLVRKHGPLGYVDYGSFKDWLRDEFAFRCAYCREREPWYPNGAAAFGVDHILPQGVAEYAHLICDYNNLVYACNRCNSAKREKRLLDPFKVAFAEHLSAQPDGGVRGLTAAGERLVEALALNVPERTETRRRAHHLLEIHASHPDDARVQTLYRHFFGYPDDLPDLAALRPPGGNTRPEGLANTFFHQRLRGTLPTVYF